MNRTKENMIQYTQIGSNGRGNKKVRRRNIISRTSKQIGKGGDTDLESESGGKKGKGTMKMEGRENEE